MSKEIKTPDLSGREEPFPLLTEALVVGLGNPGVLYEKTRHNFGFLVVQALARGAGLSFTKKPNTEIRPLEGALAMGEIEGQRVYLLLPTTYMNLSGRAVSQVRNHYKISLERLLVVADDIYLPFGTLRLRAAGGTGGHKGLRSIQESLQSQAYCRLRLGIGPQEAGKETGEISLSFLIKEYVLENFTLDEQQRLPEVIEQAVALIHSWLKRSQLGC